MDTEEKPLRLEWETELCQTCLTKSLTGQEEAIAPEHNLTLYLTAPSQPDTEPVSRLIDEHKAMGEAIIAAFGWVKEEVSSATWGVVNIANKELRAVGAKPEDMTGLYEFCKSKEWTSFTPRALSKWFAEWRKSMRQSDEPFLGTEIV